MLWKELPAQEGAEIELKGFLFHAHDGLWVLSDDPHLRSCCIGKGNKPQILLEGDFTGYSTKIPLQLKGIFHSNAQGYSLSEVNAIQKEGFPLATLVALGAICAWLFMRRFKRS